MLKTHFKYLKRAVSIAINLRNSSDIIDALENKRGFKTLRYSLICDIVSDARFYCVTEPDDFWPIYSANIIRQFIDSMLTTVWENMSLLTLEKENFLNEWLAHHIIPLSEDDKAEKKRQAYMEIYNRGKQNNGDENGGVKILEAGVEDYTDNNGDDTTNLPKEMQEYINMPNLGAGRGALDSHKADATYLKSIDPELLNLAQMIGRKGYGMWNTGKYQHSSRSDISGITIGNDLDNILPIELALLSSPSTQNIFLHKYTQKRLQIFSSASRSQEQKDGKMGPIYMCIDTSGSMNGQPEVMAKTLALAIAIIAQREKRPLIIVNYSHKVSFFVLTDLAVQKRSLMSFLSLSYSGGNDEDLLFRFIFEILPRSERYKRYKKQFSGADLLIVSDFYWLPLKSESVTLFEDARLGGMKMYSLTIGFHDYPESDYDRDKKRKDGSWYFAQSDYKFIYKKGRIYQEE